MDAVLSKLYNIINKKREKVKELCYLHTTKLHFFIVLFLKIKLLLLFTYL